MLINSFTKLNYTPVSLDCPFCIVPSVFSNVYSIQKPIPEWQQKADYIASLSQISVFRIRERGSKYHSGCNKPQLMTVNFIGGRNRILRVN
jgi:hypothetical protein